MSIVDKSSGAWRLTGPIWFGVACLTAIVLQFVSAYFIFPRPETDAIAFLPAAISFARGEGLVNPLYYLAWATDLQEVGRYTFHAPLFPWLVGSLMPDGEVSTAFGVIAGIRAATFLLMGLLLFRIAKRHGVQSSALYWAVCSVLIIAFAGMQLPTVGRPETLAALLVVAGTLLLIVNGAGARSNLGRVLGSPVPGGIVLGLLAVTHPIGALIGGLLAGLYWSILLRWRDCVTIGVSTLITALATATVVLALSPNGISDAITGFLTHSRIQTGRGSDDLRTLIHYLFFWWDRFFFFGLILVVSIAFALRLAAPDSRPKSPALFCMISAILVWTVWFTSVRNAPASYNLAMFYPIFTALAGFLLATVIRDGRLRYANVLGVALISCGLLSSISLAKVGVEFAFMIRDGKTYTEAKAALSRILPMQGQIYVEASNWVLLDDFHRVREGMQPWSTTNPNADAPAYYVSAGAVSFTPWRSAADSFDEEAVVADWRPADQPSLFGVQVSKFFPGYSFYVLRSSQPTQGLQAATK